MKKPVKVAVILGLIALGFVWRPAWGLLIVFLLVEWAEDRWKELLGAIRGARRQPPNGNEEQGAGSGRISGARERENPEGA
jgi:hypothetical protein